MRLVTLQLAIRNLLLHKLRSFLTMLGTILGVGSVISMLAIGEGSKREAIEQIRQLGATNVIVRSVKPKELNTGGSDDQGSEDQSEERSTVLAYGLTYDDLDRLQATLPTVRRAVPISLLRKDARFGSRRIPNARVLGATPEYQEIKRLKVRRGRFLGDPDLTTTANVAVLGAGAAKRLFSYQDPLNRVVHLGSGSYRIIGILGSHDSGTAKTGAAATEDQNDDIYIPLTASKKRFGEVQVIRRAGSSEYEKTELSEITLEVRDETKVSQTASMARRLLKHTHPKGDDFEVQVPLELLEQAEHEKRLWNIVLGSIAGIALLVGGIGIMNIMLATVTERTREIGIRRALGAKQKDITVQFLVETTVLSATGGVVGVIVGVGMPLLVHAAAGIEIGLSWWAPMLAFSLSVGVGIVFGLYPARRAALMDPIEALRRE